MKKILILLFLSLSLVAQGKSGDVGLVKRIEVSLSGVQLYAAKVDDKAKGMVRILTTKKTADGYKYDLEFTGMEPGDYNLIDYLRDGADEMPQNLKAHKITVGTLLDDSFDGELLDYQKTVTTLTPWYKNLNRAMIVLWVLLLPLIIFWRKKRLVAQEEVKVKEKSLNEKIRELLDSVEGNSTKELWQKIEGLIFQHWYEKKGLEGVPMHEALLRLKKDPEAGPFILKLEKGLHSKESNEKDVAALVRKMTMETAG